MAKVHHFPPTVKGDSIRPKSLTLKRFQNNTLQTLTGALVSFQVFRGSLLVHEADTAGNGGVTITDAANCVVQVDKIDTDNWVEAVHYYRVKVTYADDLEVTFVGGQLPIVSNNVSKYLEI